jgi:hypothetical protein
MASENFWAGPEQRFSGPKSAESRQHGFCRREGSLEGWPLWRRFAGKALRLWTLGRREAYRGAGQQLRQGVLTTKERVTEARMRLKLLLCLREPCPLCPGAVGGRREVVGGPSRLGRVGRPWRSVWLKREEVG